MSDEKYNQLLDLYGLKSSNINTKTTKHTLKNGLRVILIEDTSVPVANIQIWIGSGSAHEIFYTRPNGNNYAGTGVSHCLEHSVFLGSRKYPRAGEFSQKIEELGGGDNNAHTSFEHTAYHATVLSENVGEAIHLMWDTVYNPVFPPKQFSNEKKENLRSSPSDCDFCSLLCC